MSKAKLNMPLADGAMSSPASASERPMSTPPASALHEVVFAHPQFDHAALAAQAELPRLGRGLRTYYAGAHLGFGFHEDGLRAGLAAAASALADERSDT